MAAHGLCTQGVDLAGAACEQRGPVGAVPPPRSSLRHRELHGPTGTCRECHHWGRWMGWQQGASPGVARGIARCVLVLAGFPPAEKAFLAEGTF